MNNQNQIISSYINSQSRNKIVIHQLDIDEIQSLDVGIELSGEIQKFQNKDRLALKVKSKLDKILSDAITNNDEFGEILAIKNMGILFEQELKIDFLALIDNYSKNNTLFIQWDGEIENNKLFFLSKLNGKEIDIKNLSHILV